MQLPTIVRGRSLLNVLPFKLPYIRLSTDNPDEKVIASYGARVADLEDSQSGNGRIPCSMRRGTAFIAAATVLPLCILMGIAIYETPQISQAQMQNMDLQKQTCGNSTAEALALGCSFDQLLWAWLPPGCPHYANDEFLAADDWKYYVDPYGREEAVGESWLHALDNRKDLWGERREHLTHCVYLFLSLGQVIRDGTGYSSRLVAYEHLEHCVRIVLESMSRDKDWHKMETSVGRVSYDETC